MAMAMLGIPTTCLMPWRSATDPTECERLQGFPDGHTEGQADSTRYSNWATPCCAACILAGQAVAARRGGLTDVLLPGTGAPLITGWLASYELDQYTCLARRIYCNVNTDYDH